jgi:hypothetical protein
MVKTAMELNSISKKSKGNLTSLWVNICVLNRTINQLLPMMEDNLEKSKYGTLETISLRANRLIDCLSKGIYLDSDSELNSRTYQKLIDSLVDITLAANYTIDANEIGLLYECANLLKIAEKEIGIIVEST